MPTTSEELIRRARTSGRIVSTGETFGIEFESTKIHPNVLRESPIQEIFRQTHDASIETDAYITNLGFILSRNSDSRALNYIAKSNITLGTEFTSVILNNDGLLDNLKSFTDFLGDNGEDALSSRAGIHYHISLPNPNLGMLKAALILGENLESLFFHLGGMGNSFRGEENDSIYCRPITGRGPAVVSYYHGGHVQCFSIENLLATHSLEEFWGLYGDLANYNHRYQPVRYSWLNLYPMCPWGEYKGTLEFRIFNTSLNPFYLYSTLQLCQKFVQFIVANFKSLKFSDYLGSNSVFSVTDPKHNMNLLEGTAKLLELDDRDVYILEKILLTSPIPKLDDRYVFSHLNYSRSLPTFFKGKSIPLVEERISKPNYVDIHVLRGEHG